MESNYPPREKKKNKRSRGISDQIALILQIIEKAREFQKNIYFCFIDYAKAFEIGRAHV